MCDMTHTHREALLSSLVDARAGKAAKVGDVVRGKGGGGGGGEGGGFGD